MFILVCQGCHNKYHRLSRRNNRNVFPHGSGGQKSETGALAGLVEQEASLGGLRGAVFFKVRGRMFLNPNITHPQRPRLSLPS